MLDFSDPRWHQLEGGYRVLYDPRPALTQLERGVDVAAAWEALWQGLHHQGDVGVASYAAVPHLLRVHRMRDVPDWNTFGLVGIIEHSRHANQNPRLPEWLKSGYDKAWQAIAEVAGRDLMRSDDPILTRMALGVIATARGLRFAGEVLMDFTDDELEEMVLAYRERT